MSPWSLFSQVGGGHLLERQKKGDGAKSPSISSV